MFLLIQKEKMKSMRNTEIFIKGGHMSKLNKIKVLTIFGTRPEAIKMAPLVNKLNQEDCIEAYVCVTAQHREMLDQVLELFNIIPDFDLNIMKKNQTLTQITSKVLEGLEDVIKKVQPQIILVHGDTTTTFAGALAAFYHQVKVGHVEAGLRTHNKYSPFPEEMNRTLTGHMADFHFTPTLRNKENLINEGIHKDRIFLTGNTVIDALIETSKKEYDFRDSSLKEIDFEKHRIITVTCHRRENLGEYMHNIFYALKDIVEMFSDIEIVFPVHLNPKVRSVAAEVLGDIERIHLIEPLEYQPFVKLMAQSYLIITDSGGLQEEAPALGKPVLVVRKETERPEAIEAGTVKLVGVERKDIAKMAGELLNDSSAYKAMAQAVNPYGDGTASDRIVRIIKEQFDIS